MEPLQTSGRQIVENVNDLPVLSRRPAASDVAVPKEALPAQQAAQPAPTPMPSDIPAYIPPVQATPQPTAQPVPQPAPAQQAVLPTDTLAARLAALYPTQTAEQRAAEAEAKLQALLSGLNTRPAAAPSAPAPVPYTNQYNSSPGLDPAQAAAPSAEFISRSELQRILAERDAQILADQQLRQSHTVSRLEAERQFPDVFQNPQLRQALDTVWSRDPHLQADPRGPEKAAAYVRGLFYDPRAQAQPAANLAVQKQAATGIGASVPDGSGSAAVDAQQLNIAYQRARQTGRREDWMAVYRMQGLDKEGVLQ